MQCTYNILSIKEHFKDSFPDFCNREVPLYMVNMWEGSCIYRDHQLRELVIDLKEPQYSTTVSNTFSSTEQTLVDSLNIDQRTAIEKVI